jgi:hypothetical protein
MASNLNYCCSFEYPAGEKNAVWCCCKCAYPAGVAQLWAVHKACAGCGHEPKPVEEITTIARYVGDIQLDSLSGWPPQGKYFQPYAFVNQPKEEDVESPTHHGSKQLSEIRNEVKYPDLSKSVSDV